MYKGIRAANRQEQIKFCREKINWTRDQWENVVFSDETMVVIGNDQKLHICKKSDEKYVPHLVCHEEHKRIPVIFWACVTSKGVGVLFPISGTIDSQKYIEILENYIKHLMSWYFGEDPITFLQGNAPCHVSRVIWEYLEENDIYKMEWTTQSPVFNIIENMWLFIKRKIHSDSGEIKSKEDLIERFRSAWNETTQLEIEKLYASLPSRCRDFIYKKRHMSKFWS